MSILLIDDEHGLPAPEGTYKRTWEYVRLLSDPTLLESCKTGDLYRRRDEKNWEHPGYRIERDGERVKRDPHTAWGDYAIYK